MRAANPPPLVLASASPARLRLLRDAGIDAEVVVSGVDESGVSAGDPAELAGTLARLKAEAVAARMQGRALVLGCDSVLWFAGEILGKPADDADAVKRWQRMRGREGVLYTGHHLIEAAGNQRAVAGRAAAGNQRAVAGVAATTVRFADLSDEEITAYVATGEPLRVAGAFTIDGLGGTFIEGIDGDHGTVVGLSLPLFRRLLADLGISITSLWRSDDVG